MAHRHGKSPLAARVRRERWRAARAQGEKGKADAAGLALASARTGAHRAAGRPGPSPAARHHANSASRSRSRRLRQGGPRRSRDARAIPAPAATNAHVRKSMQGNKRANTKPELIVRKMLRELGYPGYRLQWNKVPGHPDIVFPGRKLAILVNGCFWHRCPVCNPPDIKTHSAYWEAKFRRNVERDAQNQAALEQLGWTVVVIWEHELKKKNLEATRERLRTLMAAKTGV